MFACLLCREKNGGRGKEKKEEREEVEGRERVRGRAGPGKEGDSEVQKGLKISHLGVNESLLVDLQ